MAEVSTEARRLAVEILATLVDVKRLAADQLLRRAGVGEDLIHRFLKDRDPATGERRSKRVAAAIILDDLAAEGRDADVVLRLIEIAAGWDAFHLAANEFLARGCVEKAREMQGGVIEQIAQARIREEAALRDVARQAAAAEASMFAQQSDLLLAQFDHLAMSDDPHGRGFLLQDLLARVFDLHGFPVTRSFQRNDRAEQIDGAFEMGGWHYIVECRWRATPANGRDLDGLLGQLQRSGRQTMAVFLAINGWSDHVVDLLRQNPDKAIILMDGYDLRMVLARNVDLRALVEAKGRALNLDGLPHLSAATLITQAGVA